MSNDVPYSWAAVKFTDVLSIQGGTQPPKKEFVSEPRDGYIRLLQIRDFGLKPVPTYIVDNGKRKTCVKEDILIGRYGASVGRICTGMEGAYNVALTKVVAPSQVNSIFLKYFLESNLFQKPLGMLSRSAQNGFNKDDLSRFDLYLPPKNEQIRIANKLDSLLAKVDAAQARLDKIPTLLKRFRQSVLAAATSGELTKEWREKNSTENIIDFVEQSFTNKEGKLKVRAKKGWDAEIELLELPENWAWIPNFKLAVDESTAICAGPFGTIFKAKDFRDEGVPIIFLRHVKEDGFNQRKPKYMDQDVWNEKHQEYSVFGGELLVTKLGDPPGEACIYPARAGISMVTPDVLKMNVDSTVAYTEYLMHFFNSPNSKTILQQVAFGLTRLRIDIAMFKNFPIPLPPFEEQKEIVRRVESLFTLADKVEQQYQAAKQRTDRLTQSLLSKAFRGDLVPQDPNDESASVLLEKIKIERERLSQVKPKRKKISRKLPANKSKPNQIMNLNEAPKTYLLDLLHSLGGETDAKTLWQKSELTIEDFYTKLKAEPGIEDNKSPDPELRKLVAVSL